MSNIQFNDNNEHGYTCFQMQNSRNSIPASEVLNPDLFDQHVASHRRGSHVLVVVQELNNPIPDNREQRHQILDNLHSINTSACIAVLADYTLLVKRCKIHQSHVVAFDTFSDVSQQCIGTWRLYDVPLGGAI